MTATTIKLISGNLITETCTITGREIIETDDAGSIICRYATRDTLRQLATRLNAAHRQREQRRLLERLDPFGGLLP